MKETRNEQMMRIFCLLSRGNILNSSAIVRLISINFFVSERQVRNIIRRHRRVVDIAYQDTNALYKSLFTERHEGKRLEIISKSESSQAGLLCLF
jgi:hypothetical protein